jgi:Cu/Ag efflux pump CusA
VALTALAAILGMIPLATSAFWGPMAITIMGGLLVATVLTLVVVPALYAIWFRVRADEPMPQSATTEEPDWKTGPVRIAAE